jgi:hypothetical protein
VVYGALAQACAPFSLVDRRASRALSTNFYAFSITNLDYIFSNKGFWWVVQIKMYFYLHTHFFLFIYSFI